MSDLIIDAAGDAYWYGTQMRCALGRGGRRSDKREGDGATPIGRWPMRRLHYRADRLTASRTSLAVRAILPEDGWSDDPLDPDYNRLVKLPHRYSHERMWREDRLYDLVVELGYNDAPPVRGGGSAIFLHLAREDWRPTEGCVALASEDLLRVLAGATPDSAVDVRAPEHKI